MTRRDPEPVGDLIQRLLARMGVRNLGAWQDLRDRWVEIVDEPWRTHSRPLALANGKLVVEASTAAAVSLLRYGVAGLISSLDSALGEGIVTEVDVRRPVR